MRRAGVLLPIASLPSSYGIGDLGPSAREWMGWLADSGQSVWQMLPTTPFDRHGCPYASPSAFAGEPLLLSPDDLVADGWLMQSEKPYAPAGPVDYVAVRSTKGHAVAVAGGRAAEANDCLAWADDELVTYALHQVLSAMHGSIWQHWPAEVKDAERQNLLDQHAEQVAVQLGMQWLFAEQWKRLAASAKEQGIQLWGDVPIFVSPSSADTWARRELFLLDEQGAPTVLTGVPPDAFTELGQLWGHAHYRLSAHARSGFDWWQRRLGRMREQFDVVRLDHFRGFEAVWEIPAGAADARGGRWVPGLGEPFLRAVVPDDSMPYYAEDLGVITPAVEALRDRFALPGMAVLQFAFGGDSHHPYLPHNHRKNMVVATGTHDNTTLVDWWSSITDRERSRVQRYLGVDGSDIGLAMSRAAWGSVANTALVPVADLLGLDARARINVPGRAEGNWSWRLDVHSLTVTLAARARAEAQLFGRT